jgi:hypothetical protein
MAFIRSPLQHKDEAVHHQQMSIGGEVANALVCKTSIHGFKSHPVLQDYQVVTPKRTHYLS